MAGNNVASEGATPAGNNVGRAAKAAAGAIAAAAGAVARGVSIATPVVVDGARRYVPAAADAVGRGAKTVWDGDEVGGKRRPGLKQRGGGSLRSLSARRAPTAARMAAKPPRRPCDARAIEFIELIRSLLLSLLN